MADDGCVNCERCTWNPGPDCGRREHSHCEKCGHCIGRHAPMWYAEEQGWAEDVDEEEVAAWRGVSM